MRPALRAILIAVVASAFMMGALPSWAQRSVPAFTSFVIDETGTFPAEERQSFSNALQNFSNQHGSQIAVLLINSLEGEAIEPYALRVVEAWKVGRKGIDDGALLLIALQDRKLRIEVGYGLEGALSDLTSKRIIEEIITPHFRAGNVKAGVYAGVEAMQKVILGENLPPPPQHSGGGGGGFSFELLIFLFIFGSVLANALRRAFGALPGAAIGGLGAGFLTLLFASLPFAFLAGVLLFFLTLFSSGRAHSGYYGGSSWGGGGGWSGGGGGFSGGGGGSFGGGGASGSW